MGWTLTLGTNASVVSNTRANTITSSHSAPCTFLKFHFITDGVLYFYTRKKRGGGVWVSSPFRCCYSPLSLVLAPIKPAHEQKRRPGSRNKSKKGLRGGSSQSRGERPDRASTRARGKEALVLGPVADAYGMCWVCLQTNPPFECLFFLLLSLV